MSEDELEVQQATRRHHSHSRLSQGDFLGDAETKQQLKDFISTQQRLRKQKEEMSKRKREARKIEQRCVCLFFFVPSPLVPQKGMYLDIFFFQEDRRNGGGAAARAGKVGGGGSETPRGQAEQDKTGFEGVGRPVTLRRVDIRHDSDNFC